MYTGLHESPVWIKKSLGPIITIAVERRCTFFFKFSSKVFRKTADGLMSMAYYCLLSNEHYHHENWISYSFNAGWAQFAAGVEVILCVVQNTSDRVAGRKLLDQLGRLVPFYVADDGGNARELLAWMERGASGVLPETSPAPWLNELHSGEGEQTLLGKSRQVGSIREKIRLVAPRRCSVLIEGEDRDG
jgi:hypothetical protein